MGVATVSKPNYVTLDSQTDAALRERDINVGPRDHYRHGGMGDLYRINDRVLKIGRDPAVILAECGKIERKMWNEDDVQRWVNNSISSEIRLRNKFKDTKLEKRFLPKMYARGEVNGRHFILMDYIEGRDVYTMVWGNGGNRCVINNQFDLDKALYITNQVAAALTYFDEEGMMHNDINDSNIMITPDGYVKIIDFGLSLKQGSQENVAAFDGIPEFRSPEKIACGPLTIKSDIYSLGMVFYFILTGDPGKGNGNGEKLAQTVDLSPEIYSTETINNVIGILTGMLAERVDDRYSPDKTRVEIIRTRKHFRKERLAARKANRVSVRA